MSTQLPSWSIWAFICLLHEITHILESPTKGQSKSIMAKFVLNGPSFILSFSYVSYLYSSAVVVIVAIWFSRVSEEQNSHSL